MVMALFANLGIAWADDSRVKEGKELYIKYCGACHGRDANGKGPVADVLSPRPTDLRKLEQRYGTPFPKAIILEFIDGRRGVRAHGPSGMPVWGEVLAEPLPPSLKAPAEARVRGDVILILDYLQTVQQPKKNTQ